MASQAAITTLNWEFSSGANPADPETVVTPYGGAATATITQGAGTGYYSSYALDNRPFYGDATGVWDTFNGSFKLDFSLTSSGGAVGLTVTLNQFYSDDGFLYPGTLSFNVAGGTQTGHTLLSAYDPPAPSNPLGHWYTDVFTWAAYNPQGNSISMTITADPGDANPNTLLVDRIQMDINGDLAAVPEPVLTQGVVAAGLAFFGFWWRRRQA